MVRLVNLTFLSGILLFASGCANIVRVPLVSGGEEKLKEADGVIAIEKEEIGTAVFRSNAGAQFGLIGAIADVIAENVSAKSSEKAVVEARNSLLEYEFDKSMIDAFASRFGEAEKLRFSSLIVSKNKAAKEISSIVEASNSDAVGVVFIRHIFSMDFSEVVVTASVVVCAKSEELRKVAKVVKFGGAEVPVLYRNIFQSDHALPKELRAKIGKAGKSAFLTQWAANNGAALRDALTSASRETADMLYWDILQPGSEHYGEGSGNSTGLMYYNERAEPIRISGAEVKSFDDRVWVRTPWGTLNAKSR